MNTTRSEHAEVSLLIPWYANGSLTGPERLTVSRHLKECAECRLELEQMQILQTRWLHEPASQKVQGDFARLMSKIELAEQSAETRAPQAAVPRRKKERPPAARRWNWRDTLRDWLAAPAGVPGGGLVLASVTGALLVVTLVSRSPQLSDANTFHTLATPGSMAALGERDLRIVFSPDIRMEQINDLIGSLNAHIIDGPTEIGAFTVRLDGTGAAAKDLSEVADRLRNNPLIMMAEPAVPPMPSASTTVH